VDTSSGHESADEELTAVADLFQAADNGYGRAQA